MNPLEILARGSIEVLGRLPFSTNYAFLVESKLDEDSLRAVYKPQRGERPLWDFPSGTLAAREVAAYEVAQQAGWDLVPPTVLRADGPFGPGSLQLFVDHDLDRHYFVLVQERRDELVAFAALDVVINNADRKGGHVIEGPDGSLWGLDHGLCFNVEPKLRTVIWTFAGAALPDRLARPLQELEASLAPGGALAGRLGGLLTEAEIAATRARAAALASSGVFPEPEGPGSMPWPLI